MLFRIYIYFFWIAIAYFCVCNLIEIFLVHFIYVILIFFIFTSLVFNVMNVYDYVHLLNQNEIPGKNSNPK